MMPFGVDNNSDGEWVLVDLGEVMVHIMQSDARNLYQLEKLWHSNTKAAWSMKIQLIAVGTKMPDWVTTGFNEYQRRFPKDMPLELL